MGDIAVDIFQETLKQLITTSKPRLIIGEKHQLQSLEEEIKYLRGFLKDTEKKRNDHLEVMKLVRQIRDLVAETENIVELFEVHAVKVDRMPYSFCEDQDHLSLDLETIKKGMRTLTTEVKKIYDENMYDVNGVAVKQLKHSSTGSGGSPRGSNTSRVVKEKVVVGFEEDVQRLIEKLDDRGEGGLLEIISIIGVGGGGKTTLARKVYDDPFTSYKFEIRAWIDVSQDYDKTRKKDLMIRILESVIPEIFWESVIPENYEKSSDDIPENYEKSSDDKLRKKILEYYEKSSDDKLGEDILKCLKGKKYLIVMDDVWGIEAWNDIQRSFPKECKGSKVLFTSRLRVQLDSIGYFPYYLAPLPTNWCWELLQNKVFGMTCCPPELVDIGEQIAEKCKGLPLAVVTIAGILAMKDKTLDEWEIVSEHLSSIIAKNEEGCMKILELSYNHLPLHLKACFLYIGGYPEDEEISVRELIWLWIAEGFIQQSEGGKSLETIAKDYLIGLIDRSLVQVARKSPLGGIKACRIHDLLRELCLKKAEDDNFLVKTNNLKCRRIFGKFSFCHKKEKSAYPYAFENWSSFDENFQLLRVLSLMSTRFKGQIGVVHLVHLRHLAYNYNRSPTTKKARSFTFPFLNFLNLETLNLKSQGWLIQLPRDIFQMVKLRHLYIRRGVFTFHHSSEETEGNGFDRSSALYSLQTLHRICACEACRSLLVRTPNLKKLGLRLDLHGGMIPEDNVWRFPDQECFKCLEKLTLFAKLPPTVGSTLSPGLKLPQTIRRITLNHTFLKWEELSLLQTLPSLEVLKLMRNSCAGPVWNTSELDGFPQLKYLRFSFLHIKEWIASEDQFPNLEVLVLDSCCILKQIPIDFGSLNELREIKLKRCQRSVEESAREIQEEQRNRNGDDDCLILLTEHKWH